jgi:hypothetical protein
LFFFSILFYSCYKLHSAHIFKFLNFSFGLSNIFHRNSAFLFLRSTIYNLVHQSYFLFSLIVLSSNHSNLHFSRLFLANNRPSPLNNSDFLFPATLRFLSYLVTFIFFILFPSSPFYFISLFFHSNQQTVSFNLDHFQTFP